MISVDTLGVVDILAFFKSLIGAFVRACKRGLKGFLRWVEEMIKGIKKGNAKSVDELLEDAEKVFKPIRTGGLRGEKELTKTEINDILEYSKKYGIKEEDIFFKNNDSDYTSYARLFEKQDVLYINTDVMPALKPINANSKVSWKGAIAHELEGHRASALAGKSNPNALLEEVQASVRASKFGIDLT
jgi:hypothetical protein